MVYFISPQRSEQPTMDLKFSRDNGELDEIIDKLVEKAGGIHHPASTREMIITALKAGQESDW